MRNMIDRAVKGVEVLVLALAAAGALIIVVQMLWISYGVFMRYAVGRPDRMVTEATALLLFPVALAGLAYAMREDSYPRVTLLTDLFPATVQKLLELLNYTVMLLVGVFFSITAVSATRRAYNSGAASEILQWPRYYFWAFVAVALLVFSLYAALRLVQLALAPAHSKPAPEPEHPDGMV
jgi:TRAP-type C4-dicarboxylate transport system permease small subunit